MKRIVVVFTALCLVFAFISCGNLKTNKEMQDQEISTMDSIAGEMDSTAKTLEKKTQEVEQDVDDLMKELE